MKKRIVVAMSGGVDSSVTAALLKNQGYEVIGMTICFNLADSTGKRPSCCGRQGIEDAVRVAHKLGIRHYTINMQKALYEYVIRDFCQQYLKGNTPNPCVRCNQYIKFDSLLKKALALDAQFLATGHFARRRSNGGYLLKKAKDKAKDQSYFLYRLNLWQLRHILFPLGNYTKQKVRDLARQFKLPVAEKPASQEICFLPDNNYREFLKKAVGERIKPGLIIDEQNNILGRHKGIAFYTIGQREGLGIARGHPLYVTKIDAKNNRITVGRKEAVYKREFLVKDVHFIQEALNPALSTKNNLFNLSRKGGVKKRVALKVKIRYNHPEALAEVLSYKSGLKVKFVTTQFAITPGQSAVFYDKDTVLGGGIIEKVLD